MFCVGTEEMVSEIGEWLDLLNGDIMWDEMKRIRVGRKKMEGVRDNENVNLIFGESFKRE